MPQKFGCAVLTNAGAALLTRAQAGEVKMQFTRLATGNGVYTSEEKAAAELQKRTALKSEKNSYSFSDYEIHSEHSVKLTAIITNQDPVSQEALINEGYYINEIGIFAKAEGESGEILYSVVVTEGSQGDFIPPYDGYSAAQVVQEYYLTVDNSENVKVETAGAALLIKDANTIIDDTTNHKWKFGIDDGKMYYTEVTE